MSKRSAGINWQIAGAGVLAAWVVAACAFEAGIGFGAGLSSPSQRASTEVEADVDQAPGRPGAFSAAIETGEIIRIEQIAARKSMRATADATGYRVVVRLPDGRSREFTEPSLDELKIGDRVQVVRSGSSQTG